MQDNVVLTLATVVLVVSLLACSLPAVTAPAPTPTPTAPPTPTAAPSQATPMTKESHAVSIPQLTVRVGRYLPPLLLLGLAVHLILPQIATLEQSLQIIRGKFGFAYTARKEDHCE